MITFLSITLFLMIILFALTLIFLGENPYLQQKNKIRAIIKEEIKKLSKI